MRNITRQQRQIMEMLAKGFPIKNYCRESLHRGGYGILAFGGNSKSLRRS